MEKVKTQSYRQIEHGENVYAMYKGNEICIGQRQDKKALHEEAVFPLVTIKYGRVYGWPKRQANQCWGLQEAA